MGMECRGNELVSQRGSTMNGIPLSALVPNTYFDEPVYLDKSYILLTPDSPVPPELVRRLQKWKYSQVFTDGKPKDNPSYLSGADKNSIAPQTIDEDIRDAEQIVVARKFISEFQAFAAALFAKYAAEGTLNLADVTEWVKKTVQAVRDCKDCILRYLEMTADADRYLVTHAVNTTVLALAIGDYLKAPPHRLIELGNACMLHEIGMTKIPESLQRSARRLSADERKAMIAHTAMGYRILKGISAPENVALAALEHHERIDGSGYPRNLGGDKITEYARIIAVACSYVAMVSRRPFRAETIGGHSAIKEFLQKSRKQYDDRVLKALVYTLSVYPVGTPVLLTNGGRAIVVKTDPASPRFPVVRVIVDPEGKTLTSPPLVQTSEAKGIGIAKALDPDEARELLAKA
jgi:HD-GYP domain-containing protein (c-di-GMP phosphodiesterase class II)